MKAEVFNIQGQSTGRSIELPEDVFGIEPNEHVIYLAVKQYLAGLRSGTHKSKEKSELSGSTRKLHKQKGTGGSRKGSIKNPLFRGGARIFGPRPRDYHFKLNKKVVLLSKKSALSARFKDESIKIVEDFTFDNPQTKEYINFLKGFKLDDKKSILITPEVNVNVFLSCRNIPGADITEVLNFNAYDILNSNTILISEKSIEVISELLSNTKD
ncbi:MAG TPA: 50S ribosomal protein L4 [Chitinophagales bacterium]|nr:50S ribosomal protein L4 [Chitinophagales bacterium]